MRFIYTIAMVGAKCFFGSGDFMKTIVDVAVSAFL
jgi:hypothetical protein